MGNTCCVPPRISSNNRIADYLQSWPGSILDWSENDLREFASCFTSHKIKAGNEILSKCPRSFFIIAEGSVEVQALLPTIRKKTRNVREFLCKKQKGDMVYAPSMRKLISNSNKRDLIEREDKQNLAHTSHKKNILDFVDTVTIKSITNSIILQLDWDKFDAKFTISPHGKSQINIGMLRTIMETNLNDYLEKIPILADLPNSKLETMVRLCRYSVQKKGSTICKEGDIGDEVFILLDGEVKVEAFASKRMVELLGDSVASRVQNNVRKSVRFQDEPSNEKKYHTARRARAKSQIILDQNKKTILEAGRKASREMLQKKVSRGSINSSSTQTTFRSSTTSMCSVQSIPEDYEVDTNYSIELARLVPGDYFGEMSTFINLPRSATVTATTNVLMASLSKVDFKTLLMAISPNLETNFENVLKQHMLQNIFQLKSPFLDSIDIEKINNLAESTNLKKFGANQIIFREGEEAHSFYFIYSGSVSVHKTKKSQDEEEIGLLFAGDYFGELALINKTQRLATITTKVCTVVLEISREDFYECFEDMPELVSEFILRIKGKNADLQSILQHQVSRQLYCDFLDKEFGSENIQFYDAVTEYKNEYESSSEEKREVQATNIIKKFLTEDSDFAVNVTSRMYKDAQELLNTKKFTESCFDVSSKEIYKMMEKDLFQRFRRSKSFTHLLERVRSYDDLDAQFVV